jgi:hypothetical protein
MSASEASMRRVASIMISRTAGSPSASTIMLTNMRM